MSWLVVILAVGCVARFTRLVTKDSITEPFRLWVEARAGKAWEAHSTTIVKPPGVRRRSLAAWWKAKYHGFWPWLDDLVHCPWCASVWIAVPVGYLTVYFPGNRFLLGGMLATTASWVAGNVQTMIGRVEAAAEKEENDE